MIPQKTTIASLLKRQGYATACFGKWHLGFGSQPNPDWNADLKPGPLELGFDHYFGIPVVNSRRRRMCGWKTIAWSGSIPSDPLVYGGSPRRRSRFPEKT